ncbi:hypothetical protein FRX31_018541 [Thalictrum thalictroides]|uniref:Uncharacterized protein n=1 Tax=Thalictrum thalictroides TaxID=46969 RepID=A0A7J6W5Q0_THATH|nr:hypothetical protein FRX31_018541 [Thalictrum thalictroides]
MPKKDAQGRTQSSHTTEKEPEACNTTSEEQAEVKRNEKAIVDRLGTQEDMLINGDSKQQEGGSYGSNTSNKTSQHVEEG